MHIHRYARKDTFHTRILPNANEDTPKLDLIVERNRIYVHHNGDIEYNGEIIDFKEETKKLFEVIQGLIEAKEISIQIKERYR